MYEKKLYRKKRINGGAAIQVVFSISLFAFFLAFPVSSYSQTTIWLEDFLNADGTTQGGGTPPKWTRDISGCTLVPPNDYFEVRSNQLEDRDLDGEAIWTSETIDISSYTNVGITTDASSSTPNLESTDYLRFYYKLDGGPETLFAINGDNNGDFDPLVASQSNLNGNSLVIVVCMLNNGGLERFRFDNMHVFEPLAGDQLACNDDDGPVCAGTNAGIEMTVISGTTYYDQVSGNNASTGNGDLTISVSAVNNDDCASALAVGEVTDLPFSTTGKTASGVVPSCGGSTPIDIWYAYTASTSGTATFDLCGSSYDTRLAIYDACGGTELACNDDDGPACSGLNASIALSVTSGTTYYVQVCGYNSNTGDGDLTIATAPVNDDCANATVINSVSDLPFSTNAATAGGDNPGCGGGTDPIDIWYAYTPTSSGTANFDLCGSSFDTRLAIWDGCGGSVLSCNDDNGPACSGTNASIQMSVTAGTTYYIQVGGYNANVGNGDLTVYVIGANAGIWVGTISSDWDTGGNWFDGSVPTASDDAQISSGAPNYPEVDEIAYCNDLLIGDGGSVTIESGANLSVAGDANCDGTLIVNNGSCAITGDLNNTATALVDVNGGTISMNGWFETGSFTWARGVVELSGGTINVATHVAMSNANGTSLMNGPFNLNIGGTLQMQAASFSDISGGTVTLTASGYVLPPSGTGTFAAYNLVINGTGTYIFARDATFNYDSIINDFEILAGTVQFLSDAGTGSPEDFYVGNDVTIASGATLNVNVNNEMLLIGDWSNSGTFNHNTGLFVFDGATTISGSSVSIFDNAIINSGKSLTGPSSGVLGFSGDLTIDGTFNHNNGTLLFSGSTQSLNGTAQTLFNNLSIASGSTTSIATSGQTLLGILKSDGILNTGGNLTLLSSASQTALIDGSGVGTVSGDINMERYLTSSFGYRYISSPLTSATANEFSPYVNLGASFPPLFRYDEDRTSAGWVKHSDPTDPLNPLEGYALNFGDASNPLTYEMTGAVSNGTIGPLTLYNHNHTYTNGFNLVGNPYPSPIDWDASSGWTRSNIDDAVYYFNPSTTDQYGGTYSSYINGVSSDGVADNIISSMQGFFIHVSDGSYPVTGSFSTTNSVRVTNLSPVFHKESTANTDGFLRISAAFTDEASVSDPVVIYFNDSSTLKFEKNRDALKIMNSDKEVPSLFAFSSDITKLSICAIPFSDDSIRIVPLGLKTEKEAWVSFFADKMEGFPYDMTIYFHDALTGAYHDLNLNPEFKITLPPGEHLGRFSLVFTQKDLRYKPADDELYYAYSFDGEVFIYINTPVESENDITLINMMGQGVWEKTFYGNAYHQFYPKLTPGIYILRIHSDFGTYTKKLFIGS